MRNENVRIALTNFLQWNDRNGVYSDQECEILGIDNLTIEESIISFFYNMWIDIYSEYEESAFEIGLSKCVEIAQANNIFDKGMALINQIVTDPSENTYRNVVNHI